MSRRTSRLLTSLTVVGLLATLSACGKDDDKASGKSSSSPSGSTSASASSSAAPMTDGTVEGITVTGDVGSAPKATWGDAGVTQTDPVRQVLVKGDGAAIETGDKVFVHIWVGNGRTKKQAYTDFTGNALAITADPAQTLSILAGALEGQSVGSRVLVAQSASGAFGDPTGNAQMKLKADDTAVFVVDVVGSLLTGPDGTDKTPAKWAPAVTSSGDIPVGLDFTGTPEPTGKFNRTTLIEGKGAAIAAGDHIFVNYLGAVYAGEKPFDQSYDQGVPFEFDLGAGRVIRGWDEGLVGVKVGSRVILQIPPDWGYGKKGAPSVGIKGTDTLYFVVDVLGAS